MRIDLSSIDRTQFHVTRTDHGWLIVPSKVKHVWAPHELHLRSLIVDDDGEVLSSGFPKFFNIGEKPEVDAELVRAIERGEVEFSEKIDGSLLIGDRIRGVVNWRTRGQSGLGSFEPLVREALVRYPKLEELMNGADWLDGYSVLFEFTTPPNELSQTIIKYDTPDIRLLALVQKDDLLVVWDGPLFERVKREAGLSSPVLHQLPGHFKQMQAAVAAWSGVEGVVARWKKDGKAWLAKVKSIDYLMRHSIKNRMTPRRVRQMVLMLNVERHEDLVPHFYELGLDYEVVEMTREEVETFLVELRGARERFEAAQGFAREIAQESENKKSYVQRVMAWQKDHPEYNGKGWFGRFMSIYDGKLDGAWVSLLAEITGESGVTVDLWIKTGASGFRNLLVNPENALFDDIGAGARNR